MPFSIQHTTKNELHSNYGRNIVIYIFLFINNIGNTRAEKFSDFQDLIFNI